MRDISNELESIMQKEHCHPLLAFLYVNKSKEGDKNATIQSVHATKSVHTSPTTISNPTNNQWDKLGTRH